MKRATVVLALLAAPILTAEPGYQGISASQTVSSATLPRLTQEVTIVSDGPNTCYFRLFTDVDTAAAATTSHSPIKAGEGLSFTHRRYYTHSGWSRYYKSISAICASGQTATWRVYTQQGEASN